MLTVRSRFCALTLLGSWGSAAGAWSQPWEALAVLHLALCVQVSPQGLHWEGWGPHRDGTAPCVLEFRSHNLDCILLCRQLPWVAFC